MSKDSIIHSAIELMADDATQKDHEKGMSYWVHSERKTLEKELNEWLEDVVDVNQSSWTWCYKIVKYGEAYLRTFFQDENFEEDENTELGDHFELINEPLSVACVQKYGNTVGYLYSKTDSEKYQFLPKQSIVHMVSDRAPNRQEVEVENEDGEIETYTIKYGTSFLEPARQAYRVFSTAEDMILSARIAKSYIFKIAQIEVGKASRSEARKVIREVKRAFQSDERFDKDENRYHASGSPVALNDIVYLPTRDGKGEVRFDSEGGNVDIRNLADIEHFRNKLFSALKIPKTFMGFEESLPGQMGSTSLTALDIRYARTVKRLQRCVEQGIRQLCNFYLHVNDQKNHKDNFEVRSSAVSSAEELERMEIFSDKVRFAGDILDMFGDRGAFPEEVEIDKEELAIYILEEIMDSQRLREMIKKEGD